MPSAKIPSHRRLEGFPPIAAADACVLVLGSMPGAASLDRGEYYAHRDNAFWPIVTALCDAGRDPRRRARPAAEPAASYAARTQRLRRAGIAVWDVLRSCVREGSLDADIDAASAVTNDFPAFFAAHPRLRAVFCNGNTAFSFYRRLVLPRLSAAVAALPVVRLPSTSPAFASLTRAQKCARWRAAIAPVLATRATSRPSGRPSASALRLSAASARARSAR